MKMVFEIAYSILGIVCLISFSGALTGSFLLVRYYDDGEERNWFTRWQYSANPTLSRDYYRKEGWQYWQLRDRCLKAFVICCGVLAILAVLAAVMDLEIGGRSQTSR